MLSPDYLERAGDMVAGIYNDIEAKMLDHLVDALLHEDVLSQRDMTALALLSQTHDAQLRQIIEDNREYIDEAVAETAERFLRESDEDDIKRAGGGASWPQQVAATIDGIALILERDNLQMVEGAKQAFLKASTTAITRVNAGTMTADRALHAAVRELEAGVPIITYQNRETGQVTVQNRVDVAVRRHVRTQIAQDGARMTMERMDALGIDLVEVSSHAGSRPSHAAWQGRCYSLRGDVEIDGVKYPDFYAATQYGSVSGLLGANCRHSYGPYRHGAPRMYEPEPKHPSGLPGEEVYELEQTQRMLERRIRDAKRQLRGAVQLDEAQGTLASRAALVRAQDKLSASQQAMRDLIKEANAKAKNGETVLTRRPNREWAGDMPKVPTRSAIAAESKVSKKDTTNSYSVKRRVVNGEAYKERFHQLGLPKRAAQTIHQQAMRILEDMDGKVGERLCAISWRKGELVVDTFGSPPVDFASGFTPSQVKEIENVDGGVVLIHNHPGSGMPSATDILTLAGNDWCRASVIVCHDGTIYMPRVLKDGVVEAYNEIEKEIMEDSPYESDRSKIEKAAQVALYDENEEERWFKIVKK